MTSGEQIISIVGHAAQSLEIHLMLVGAAARDFWINRFAVPTINVRTTQDVDLACWVASWQEYTQLMELLVSKYGLFQDTSKKHRLWFRDEISVDIVPFGGLEAPFGEIAWPPNYETTMNVLGFQAACHDAEVAAIGDVELRVISPYWLAFLKMNAYTDNQDRTKDLTDLHFIIDNHFDFIDKDKYLYGENAPDADIFNLEDFDVWVAGAKLIARHCKLSDDNAAAMLQRNVRTFNNTGRMTAMYARLNGIPLEMAERIFCELLT